MANIEVVTEINEDLKEIQSQEDPLDELKREGDEEAQSGPLGPQPFSADTWSDMTDDGIEQFWGDVSSFKRVATALGKPKIGKSNWPGAFAAGQPLAPTSWAKSSKPLKVMGSRRSSQSF